MSNSFPILGELDAQTFINEYWQKKPCLIRNAYPDFTDPLSPEELAGLACEDDVQSRIVLEHAGEQPWEVRHGSFNEDDFLSLPEKDWTLLVQDMNQHDVALATLLDNFDFIPAWRLDDIMVSYAPLGGSVGPHVDQYDVFLLQGMGQRRWQIQANPGDDILPDTELCILSSFDAEEEWVLESGDMLYLPPGVAHYGVALSDCMTYSIGFRSPLLHDLLTEWSDTLLLNDTNQQRYTDASFTIQGNPAELSQERVDTLYEAMMQCANNKDSFAPFIARLLSQPSSDIETIIEPAYEWNELLAELGQQQYFQRSEYARFLYITRDDGLDVYINGESTYHQGTVCNMIMQLCSKRVFLIPELSEYQHDQACQQTLLDWFNQGYLFFASDD